VGAICRNVEVRYAQINIVVFAVGGKEMSRHASYEDILQSFNTTEENLSRFLMQFGVSFSPVLVLGDIANPGFFNLPSVVPITTQLVTYTAAGMAVSDTYSGVNLWNLLADAGGVTVTSAKNDILSKYVVATGSDGYKAVFSLGEIDPSFGAQPVMAAFADTAGQLGPQGTEGLARMCGFRSS
jgi:hypothetical protein